MSLPEATTPNAALLTVRQLSVTFATEEGPVQAVRGLSYEVRPGEILAIVGESGSGKSVSSLAVMGLLPSNAQVEAEALVFGDHDLQAIEPAQMRALRDGRVCAFPQEQADILVRAGPRMAEGARLMVECLNRTAALPSRGQP